MKGIMRVVGLTVMLATTAYGSNLNRGTLELDKAPLDTKHENGSIAILTYLHLKPGTEDQFMAELVKIVKPSKAEPGNIAWYVQQAEQDPTQIVFYTRWINQEALDKHLQSPPVAEYIRKTAAFLAEPARLVRFHPLDSSEDTSVNSKCAQDVRMAVYGYGMNEVFDASSKDGVSYEVFCGIAYGNQENTFHVVVSVDPLTCTVSDSKTWQWK